VTPDDQLLALTAHKLLEQDRDPRLRWHDDPAGFARDCIEWPEGTELAGYQAMIFAALGGNRRARRAAVRSLHGAGKTALAAILVLWFAITRDAAGIDWKCITTAGGWRQLERYLWPEIHKWARRIRWDVVGRDAFDARTELTALTLKLTHGQAFAAASDDAALLEGLHGESVLIVADESKSISAAVFDAIEGAMSGTGEVIALALSTPGPPSGRFYEIHARRPGLTDWRTFHVGLHDAIAAGRVSEDWAEQRALQWGSESAIYANRVLGNFAADDEAGVIPLTWVEAAVDRWRAWKDSGDGMPIAPPVIGVDVGGGVDKTVITRRRGDVVEFLERHNTPDTMTVAGHAFPYSYEPGALTVIDAIGIGSGAASRLREQGCSVDPFMASSGSNRRDRAGAYGFLNRRAEAWWHLRELLDPAFGPTLALPDDDELIADLSAPRWWPTSAGKIQIEAKSDVRKRLGRSPDAGDAVVMACCGLSGTWSASQGQREPQKAVQWSSMDEGRRDGWEWDTSFPGKSSGPSYPPGFAFTHGGAQ
jgi:hypothetical protein